MQVYKLPKNNNLDIPNFGFTSSTVWFRINIKKNENLDKKIYLNIQNSNIDNVEIYEILNSENLNNNKYKKQQYRHIENEESNNQVFADEKQIEKKVFDPYQLPPVENLVESTEIQKISTPYSMQMPRKILIFTRSYLLQTQSLNQLFIWDIKRWIYKT
jgi:hypothetical protein